MSHPNANPLPLKLAIAGAGGRMGRTLARFISDSPDCQLCGALEHDSSPLIGQDIGLLAGTAACGVAVTSDIQAVLKACDGVIDFTTPQATTHLLRQTAAAGLVHVIGTTGLDAAGETVVREAAKQTAIVKSGNMSLGVNLLAVLVQKAAATLGPDFDIEIVEMHHRAKVDAPSGTALLLGEAAARGRKVKLADAAVRVRDGYTGARQDGDIGFAALRGGSVVGEHTVIFAGSGERIELAHKAESRDLFARGAIRAALWARGKKPGLYSMLDVLGLE
jgi:4-hydroxy-tetrahydrodipicolinate reductase